MNFEHEYRHSAPESWHALARALPGTFTGPDVWASPLYTVEQMNLKFQIMSIGSNAEVMLPKGLYLFTEKLQNSNTCPPLNGYKLTHVASVVEGILNKAEPSETDDDLDFIEAVINDVDFIDSIDKPDLAGRLYLEFVPVHSTAENGIIFKVCEITKGSFANELELDNDSSIVNNN